MRHTSRHTRAHGGGGCCVRSEGAVGVLSELELGSAEWVSWHSGVLLLYVCGSVRGRIKSENIMMMGHTRTLGSLLKEISCFFLHVFCSMGVLELLIKGILLNIGAQQWSGLPQTLYDRQEVGDM